MGHIYSRGQRGFCLLQKVAPRKNELRGRASTKCGSWSDIQENDCSKEAEAEIGIRENRKKSLFSPSCRISHLSNSVGCIYWVDYSGYWHGGGPYICRVWWRVLLEGCKMKHGHSHEE